MGEAREGTADLGDGMRAAAARWVEYVGVIIVFALPSDDAARTGNQFAAMNVGEGSELPVVSKPKTMGVISSAEYVSPD